MSQSRGSAPYLPEVQESLLLPEGAVSQEEAGLLHDLVHPTHSDGGHTLIEDLTGVGEEREWKDLPWYKRPSPIWFLCLIPVATIANASTAAPRIEIYTQLACEVLRPEYTSDVAVDRERCAADPAVQAVVAKLNLVMATILGILSCLTTSWWTSLSDRYGRIRIMSISVFGILLSDLSFLVVTRSYKVLPGGYWLFVLGSIVDGSMGGLITASATIHAYLSDCSDATSRSRVFSLYLGLLYVGLGAGPTIGGLVVRFTGAAISVFYATMVLHIFYSCIVWFVIPESLSKKQQNEARITHNLALEEAKRVANGSRLMLWSKRMFGFLDALNVLLPVPTGGNVKPSKPVRRDWSLGLVAASYGFALSIMGSYNYKFQYASATFGWNSEQLGYWLSIIGVTRAVFLTVLLPVGIKWVHSRTGSKPSHMEESDPLLTNDTSTSRPGSTKSTNSISFDLNLAKISLVVEVFVYTVIPLSTNGLVYTAITVINSFGSGYSPAVQSVALGLYNQRGGKESGKLFGALSVVQVITSQVASPAIYGLVYMKTVATFPTAIFFLASASITISLLCLVLVRLPKAKLPVDLEDPNELPPYGMEQEEVPTRQEVPIIVVNGPSTPNTPRL